MNNTARNERIIRAWRSGVSPEVLSISHGMSLRQIHRILNDCKEKRIRTSPWTEEAVALVRALAVANRSATQISTALKDIGVHTTRNSVIGLMSRAKIRRPDLPEKNALNGAIAAAKKRDPNRVISVQRLNPTTLNVKRAARVEAARAGAGGEEAMAIRCSPRGSTEAAWAPLEGVVAVSIHALQAGVCRWPLEARDADGLTMYCGAACDPERVYCVPHALLASGGMGKGRDPNGAFVAYRNKP